jgi:hypothetical protein
VGLWKLLQGRIALKDFRMAGFRLNMVKRDSTSNYMFLLEGRDRSPRRADTITVSDYSGRAGRLITAVFDKIPSNLGVTDFDIQVNIDGHTVEMRLDSLEITDHNFLTTLQIKEDTVKQSWIADGSLDPGRRTARCSLYNSAGRKVVLPYISRRWEAYIGFDTIRFSLSTGSKGNITVISGTAGVAGLGIEHRRISKRLVEFDELATEFTINIGRDYIEMDSATTVSFNKVLLNQYMHYRPRPTKQYSLVLNTLPFPAQDLFSSLPPGLFQNLEGMKAKGDLSFRLEFDVDLSFPDSLHFLCELKPHKFFVTSFGATDFRVLNSSFEYTAYEEGVPVKSMIVGPENPDFRPLDRISPHLKYSVMNSEDGAFYGHQGFLPDAFRESIAANIKARRFVRGGSTITMQLVKNVFLNRNKTIARKVEEALIVWLIENYGLCSKDRMLEVYLNIIEWGPMVYGAQEASLFYFSKDASALSLAEAIFMASVIPRPKYFRWSFDESGQLRDYLKNYYRFMSERMLRKEMISQYDFDQLQPFVELKGLAKDLLIKPDSTRPDTTDLILLLPDEARLPDNY